MSPVAFEQKFLAFEKSCIEKLSRGSGFLWFALVWGVLNSWLSYSVWARPQPDWSRFFLAQDRYWGAATLFFGFYFSFVIPHQIRVYFHRILFVIVWLVPCYLLKIERPIVLAPVLYVVICTVALSWPRSLWTRKIVAALVVLFTFVGLLWWLGKDAELAKDYRLFRFFWVLHLEMLLIYFLRESFRAPKISLSVALNPLQLFSPLPWPTDLTLAEKKWEIRSLQVSGLMQIIFAQLLFWILLLTVPSLPVDIPVLGHLLQYVTFVIFATAALNCVSGMLRMFGFRAADATYFLVLAKSPLEIWQRGSTYMAQFLFQVVFFPIWKQTRKMWVAGGVLAILVLIHIYFFHELFLRELLRWLAPTLPIAQTSWDQIIWLPVFWFLSWMIWMTAFYLLTKAFRFLKTENGAWVAILLTHLGSSQIFWLAKEMATLCGVNYGG